MALDAKIACNDHCSAAANCRLKAIGQMKPVGEKHETSILGMLAARDRIHKVISDIKSGASNGSCGHKRQIVSAIDASCDGGHSHGHGCSSHNLGHHHETIELNGKTEEICDVDDLQRLANEIGNIIADCKDKDYADGLRSQLGNLQTYIGELRKVSTCTQQMCAYIANQKGVTTTIPASALKLPDDF